MKVTLNWLKQYVDFTGTPEELKERLTMIGIEVESMRKVGGEFDGVVVAQILSSNKHPNADKLSLCRVADGQGERQIVCGASNFKAGDKVPLALPGCELSSPAGAPPFVIKVGKIRGIESHGMMCSPKELGLAEDATGLLILPAEAKVGQPFAEYLGRTTGDIVYDLEITPNRPDLNSVIGIAREVAAATKLSLRLPVAGLPALATPKPQQSVLECVAVRLDAPDLCPRYTARLIRGLKIGPSPDWLRNTIEKVGLRSINNVVDVTNYVMMETGQPLHAFDYHLITPLQTGAMPTIVVRRAAEGEKFTTLDGQERLLDSQMLVIADETKAVALAGIMGGQNSEINERTVDVLLESACFKPQSIRMTSRKLDLKSDASYRFERGSDIGACDWASQRAVQLLLQTAGGDLASGVVDAYPSPVRPRQIQLRFQKTNQLLGVEIPAALQAEYLERLKLQPLEISKNARIDEPASTNPAAANDSGLFAIPSYRVDLKRETDLIEEVGRMHGVDRIPSRTLLGTVGSHEYDRYHDQLLEARRILVGLGLNEAQGQTLIPETAAKLVTPDYLTLQNPLSSDMNVLRPTLIPGMLDSLQDNLNHRITDVALFEIGRVFLRTQAGPREERRLTLALTGRKSLPYWRGEDREARLDLYDLKGILEVFFKHFGVKGVVCEKSSEPGSFYAEHAVLRWGKQVLGVIGQLLPALARSYDMRDAVLLAELDVDMLIRRRNPARIYQNLPVHPSIRRDIAMLVPESVTHEAVLTAIKQAKLPNLENVELFDVFRGRNVPEGQKSMAYAFIYRCADRTLTDNEVNNAQQKLTQHLQQVLHATVRDS